MNIKEAGETRRVMRPLPGLNSHRLTVPCRPGGAGAGRQRGRLLQGQDRDVDRRLPARRRLRHLCARAGAALRPLPAGPAERGRRQHAGRGLADGGQQHLRQIRAGRPGARHVRLVGGDGAADRQQVGAVRSHEIQLDRLDVAGRGLLRRLAASRRRDHLRRDADQGDDHRRRCARRPSPISTRWC